MRKLFAAALLLGGLAAAPVQAQQTSGRFDRSARLHDYATSLTDVVSWGSVAASTLLDQILDDPEAWTFGDRALSNSARFVLEESIYHGIAAVQDRSTWYSPCECTDLPTRTVHAFTQTFIDHDRSGAAHISAARIGAPYGAAVAEAVWRPDVSVGDAIMTGTTSLVFTGVFNIVREYIGGSGTSRR